MKSKVLLITILILLTASLVHSQDQDGFGISLFGGVSNLDFSSPLIVPQDIDVKEVIGIGMTWKKGPWMFEPQISINEYNLFLGAQSRPIQIDSVNSTNMQYDLTLNHIKLDFVLQGGYRLFGNVYGIGAIRYITSSSSNSKFFNILLDRTHRLTFDAHYQAFLLGAGLKGRYHLGKSPLFVDCTALLYGGSKNVKRYIYVTDHLNYREEEEEKAGDTAFLVSADLALGYAVSETFSIGAGFTYDGTEKNLGEYNVQTIYVKASLSFKSNE